jgi:hypothetical protein
LSRNWYRYRALSVLAIVRATSPWNLYDYPINTLDG